MKVSILLPAYNASLYLQQALDSIIEQTFNDFEVLLIDDGSSDNTSDIAREYSNRDVRIKYYKNEQNMGLIKTLNKGLMLAKGEYIVRMDSDDIMIKDRLHKQVVFMDANPECIVSGGQIRYFGDLKGRAPKLPLHYEDLRYMALTNCPLYHPTVIVRASSLKKLGLNYNESYIHAEDYKLWSDIIMSTSNSVENIDDIILNYRISKDQITSKYKNVQDIISKQIRRENVDSILSSYGVNLPKEIDYKVISVVSKLIKSEKKYSPILVLILFMLYMSINDVSIRIKHYVSSKDFLLFISRGKEMKLGLMILCSALFPNRGKRFTI